MHTPVLLKESIEALQVREGGKYVDGTYGLGGHSRAIAEAGGMVLALDWDQESVKKQNGVLEESGVKKILLVHANYADIERVVQEHSWTPCQGVILDLGLSMDQIRTSGRGFSYEARDEPLDMRIDQDLQETAADIVNSYTVDELYDIFTKYAEELNSRPISEALYSARRIKKLETVGDVLDAIETVTKSTSTKARIFQALRIVVNNEYDNIRRGMQGAYNVLEKGGRVAIITFHPGEDRLVKIIARQLGIKFDNKKPITSSSGMKFERSAKLRVITKI